MVRVFQGIVACKCHNGIINPAKGFIGSHSVLFKTANMQIMKVLIYAYTGPKKKKDNFKKFSQFQATGLFKTWNNSIRLCVK